MTTQQPETQKPAQELTIIGQICKTVDAMEGSLNEALKDTGVSVKRFLTVAKTAIQTHGDKNRLEQANRQTLFLAIKKCAADGLLPDGREAALVVYNVKISEGKYENQVQYQPMVQGLVKLMRNSGEIEDVDGFIVHENDKFSFKAGKDKMPDHEADWFGKRGNPIGAWAFVKLKNGEVKVAMLTKDRIDRIAQRSKMAGNYNPTTGKDWEEFWKKAAIRNVSKYAPKSSQLDGALKEADKEFDFSGEDDLLNGSAGSAASVPASPEEVPVKETRASAAVRRKAEATVIDVKAEEVKTDGDHDGSPSPDEEPPV